MSKQVSSLLFTLPADIREFIFKQLPILSQISILSCRELRKIFVPFNLPNLHIVREPIFSIKIAAIHLYLCSNWCYANINLGYTYPEFMHDIYAVNRSVIFNCINICDALFDKNKIKNLDRNCRIHTIRESIYLINFKMLEEYEINTYIGTIMEHTFHIFSIANFLPIEYIDADNMSKSALTKTSNNFDPVVILYMYLYMELLYEHQYKSKPILFGQTMTTTIPKYGDYEIRLNQFSDIKLSPVKGMEKIKNQLKAHFYDKDTNENMFKLLYSVNLSNNGVTSTDIPLDIQALTNKYCAHPRQNSYLSIPEIEQILQNPFVKPLLPIWHMYIPGCGRKSLTESYVIRRLVSRR